MTIHILCLLAILAAEPLPPSPSAQSDVLLEVEPNLLIDRHEGLVDVNELQIVLVTEDAGQTASIVDYDDLHAQIVEVVAAVGIEHVEGQTTPLPQLRVDIETVRLSDGGQCVYRVQTALSRMVMLPGYDQTRMRADVWRVRPVMKAVTESDVADAIKKAVLTQAETFAGELEVARKLQARWPDFSERPSAAGQAPYVASKNSAVFHRADCPMAGNIAERNLVTYDSRQDAIQAGKRPCKSCNP